MTPRVHILRDTLPWATSIVSECGRLNPRCSTTWGSYIANKKDYDILKSVCYSCSVRYNAATLKRWAEWANQPGEVIARYTSKDRQSINADLWALAKLAELHPDEFEVLRWEQARRHGAKS